MIPPTTLRARFDAPDALGIGIEEELFLLDGETLDLLPHAREVLERVDGDPRFKLELPASQLEIVTPPCPDVATAVDALRAARRDLARGRGADRPADDRGRAPDRGRARRADRRPALPAHARRVRRARAPPARLRPAPARLARRRRPHAGGLQRAALAPARARRAGRQRALPRAAATPAWPRSARRSPSTCSARACRRAIPSWEWFADALQLGRGARTRCPDARRWWFELRLHATYGTLELRAPDAQSSVDDVHGVAAFAYDADPRAGRPPRRGRDAAGRTTRGGSTRTAGRRCATASRARSPTSTRASACPRASCCVAPGRRCSRAGLEHTRALIEANGAIRTRAVGVDARRRVPR